MLIKALCDYDDMTSSQLPEYLSEQSVHYRIMLTKDGDIADIENICEEREIPLKSGKTKTQLQPRKIEMPKRSQKSGIDFNTAEHRPLYIFGLNYDKGVLTVEDKTNKAKKSHQTFKDGTLDFFNGLTSDICVAFYKFAEKWVPENETENPELIRLGKDISTSYFCFALNGHPEILLHEDGQMLEKFAKQFHEKNASDDKNSAICAVMGEKLPIARIHEKISGVRGANSVGATLVGVNNAAFESYGKTQSFNTNISETAMKKYTSALNRLLADPNHRVVVDEMTLIFFSLSENDAVESAVFGGEIDSGMDLHEIDDNLKNIITTARNGGKSNLSALDINENDTFYIVGLVPNSSRISQKFILRKNFGLIMDNIYQHQKDLQVSDDDTRNIYTNWIAKELVSPKATNPVVPTYLISDIFYAIFNGTNYPRALLETTVRRVKTDSDDDKNKFIKINNTRIGIIKACLNRKDRLSKKEEEIKMSLDTQNNNPAYLCGRLFAVLEKIQQDAQGMEINKTIKDSFFATACTKPATVFPRLLILSQNHMAKSKRVVLWTKKIGDIVDMLDGEFPSTLSIEDQGKFIIGYYQENKDLWAKKETTENN